MAHITNIILILKVFTKNIFKIRKILNIKFTLVTASDEKHYQYLKSFVKNFCSVENNNFSKLIIFDLGLNKGQLQELKEHKLIEIRRFPFENYPKHFAKRLTEHKNKIGGFAWKPEIINFLKNENITHIIWLDSATSFNKNLLLFKMFIHEYGFASFYSTGNIKQWTHQSVLRKLKIINNPSILSAPNLMAGVVGFDFNSQFAKNLHDSWNKLCSNEDMIFPVNSNFSNHRHDQSLLSVTYWKLCNNKLPQLTKLFGIGIQNWPNKILFFFDENHGLRKKLLKEHSFNSTTTDKRSKIIILFNSDSLRKIPLRLIFKKKVLLFNLDDEDKKPFFRYFVKKRFIDVYNLRNKYHIKNQKENLIDFGYIEVNKIIKEQYKYITNEK
jgi:hypothetical protein